MNLIVYEVLTPNFKKPGKCKPYFDQHSLSLFRLKCFSSPVIIKLPWIWAPPIISPPKES